MDTEYPLCIERGACIGVDGEFIGGPIRNGGIQVRQELSLDWFGFSKFTDQVLDLIFD